jgi:hypothetical protein
MESWKVGRLMIDVYEITKEQLSRMIDVDEDWLIEAFDVDEDAIVEYKKAIQYWISTDLGKKKKTRSEFTEKRTGAFKGRRSARVVRGNING